MKKNKKNNNTKKSIFQSSVTWPKTRAPLKHYENRGFREHIKKNSFASRNGHFWTPKMQIQKFQLSFVFVPLFSFNNKKHKSALKPIFYSVLAKSKQDIFQKVVSKHRKLKNLTFAPFFEEGNF